MDVTELVDDLKYYCEANNILFVIGTQSYINAVTDQHTYAANQLILLVEINASVIYLNGVVNGVRYTGSIALGRKIDSETTGTAPNEITTTTVASLDETFEQKYNRRLKFLSNKLATLIGAVACDGEYEVENCDFRLDINQFDFNADFVGANITIVK